MTTAPLSREQIEAIRAQVAAEGIYDSTYDVDALALSAALAMDQLTETQRIARSYLDRAQAAEAERVRIIGLVQRFQPDGSPPPLGGELFVGWILDRLRGNREELVAENLRLRALLAEAREALRDAHEGAVWILGGVDRVMRPDERAEVLPRQQGRIERLRVALARLDAALAGTKAAR